jgi:outer membrane protein assembly factor BamC
MGKTGGAATATAATPASAPASGPATVALAEAGDLRIDRQGEVRWLSTSQSPEQVWPKVKEFWLSKGFTLASEDPQTGIMQTGWLEDRTKLPGGFIRESLGKVFDSLWDSGMRDRFRTRLERGPNGRTEVYVAHFGAVEELTGFDKSEVVWVPRPSDPGLEGQMLSQMMLALGGVPALPTNVATAPPGNEQGNTATIASAATLPAVGAPRAARRARTSSRTSRRDAAGRRQLRSHMAPCRPGARSRRLHRRGSRSRARASTSSASSTPRKRRRTSRAS